MTLNNRMVGELERRCFASFDGKGGSTLLLDLADALLERQKKNWPGLIDGYAALSVARTREIRGDGWGVRAQFNPRRIVSSGAKLDPESIRRRPCFLCPENLPPEQEAICYREDYLILCNPAPIFPGHRTISHICHLPQSLPDHLGIFLQLAADFGSRMTVFYNGPLAGASAPDHLHFQAAPAGLMPVEAEILHRRKRVGTKRRDGVKIFQATGLGRGILVIEGEKEGYVAAVAGDAIRALGCLTSADGEPPLNMLCTCTKEGWRLILFPRRKHRPGAYFRKGRERLLISPGAADMGGTIITPREEDFLTLTPELVSEIFREVAFDDTATAALLTLLTGKCRPV
jgi:hypothetical protein